eukprot:14472550-Ditylum_brightwellii.AAC.1
MTKNSINDGAPPDSQMSMQQSVHHYGRQKKKKQAEEEKNNAKPKNLDGKMSRTILWRKKRRLKMLSWQTSKTICLR